MFVWSILRRPIGEKEVWRSDKPLRRHGWCTVPVIYAQPSHVGGSYRKRAVAMSAAVRGSGRYRRPLQEAAVAGGCYRRRTAAMAAAVA